MVLMILTIISQNTLVYHTARPLTRSIGDPDRINSNTSVDQFQIYVSP